MMQDGQKKPPSPASCQPKVEVRSVKSTYFVNSLYDFSLLLLLLFPISHVTSTSVGIGLSLFLSAEWTVFKKTKPTAQRGLLKQKPSSSQIFFSFRCNKQQKLTYHRRFSPHRWVEGSKKHSANIANKYRWGSCTKNPEANLPRLKPVCRLREPSRVGEAWQPFDTSLKYSCSSNFRNWPYTSLWNVEFLQK